MTCWKQSAQTQFDSWSGAYDRSMLQWLFFRPSHDAILKSLRIEPGMRVLDLGCGTGRFALRLLEEFDGIDVVGLDLSPKMLEKAAATCRRHGPRFQPCLGDSEHLPFPDGDFDVVTCSHSFHHYPNQQAVASEIFRVLKPAGQVCLVDGNRDGWWGWLVFDLVVTAIERNVHHCSGARFRELLSTAGFGLTRQKSYGWIAPFLVTVAVADKRRSTTSTARKAA